MLEWSLATTKLETALLELQKRLPNVHKNKTNPHFKSRYADLEACVSVAKPHLNELKILVHQALAVDPKLGTVNVTTRLVHEGEWMQQMVSAVPRDLSPQSVGAAATFLRRYGFCTALGLVADEDDDGNAAQGRQGRQERPQQQRRPAADAGSQVKDATFPTYDKTNEQMRKWLVRKLKEKQVPQSDWHLFSDKFVGQTMSDDNFERFFSSVNLSE